MRDGLTDAAPLDDDDDTLFRDLAGDFDEDDPHEDEDVDDDSMSSL